MSEKRQQVWYLEGDAVSGSNMADPYRIYGSVSELDDLRRSSFPGYAPSDASSFSSNLLRSPNNLRGPSLDYLQNHDIPLLRPGPYGLDDVPGLAARSTVGIDGFTPGMGIRGFSSPLEHSSSVRRDVPLEINRAIPDVVDERTSSLRNVDGLVGEESNMLYVDGLPTDCMRREVAHLFRPFIGFKDIRVIHKEARRDRDKAQVFCFVEFTDSKCALTAMEALQGYKFDDKKPDTRVLRIQFAKFPFRPSSSRDE